MSVDPDRPPDAGAAACPCRHGDVAAEVSRQRPLLELATRGDREAFARLYDAQVEGVYRYLLAWTGDRAATEELTEQVFRTALAWLPVIAGEVQAPTVEAAGAPYPEAGDVGVWLIAMARDAVAQRRGAGWMAGPSEQRPVPADPLEAVALLGDPEREVVVLRLLLGHSLAHAAHLSGYSQRAVVELQLAACLAIRTLTSGSGSAPPDPTGQTTPRAMELESRLERWDVDLSGDDPELADALAVASSLRLAAPTHVAAPAHGFVERLRAQLLGAPLPVDGRAEAWNAAGGGRDPEAPRKGAGGGPRRAVAAAWVEVSLRPKPWAATAVASTLIVVILALQAFGSPGPRPPCRGAACPQATIRAAPASATAAPLTSIRRKDTTTTPPTLPAPTTVATAPAPTAPATATPATTIPAATAPRTTRPRRTTTTGQPATTAATTTSSTTTTTAPPSPP
jgi:DNA-directed RNA polymerase specialized sigma24 family protein